VCAGVPRDVFKYTRRRMDGSDVTTRADEKARTSAFLVRNLSRHDDNAAIAEIRDGAARQQPMRGDPVIPPVMRPGSIPFESQTALRFTSLPVNVPVCGVVR